jgi:hypothetical protein
MPRVACNEKCGGNPGHVQYDKKSNATKYQMKPKPELPSLKHALRHRQDKSIDEHNVKKLRDCISTLWQSRASTLAFHKSRTQADPTVKTMMINNKNQ